MESGQELLKRILFGGKLTDKLAGGSAFSEWDWQDSKALMEVIESPGREGLLAPRSGVKSAFPRHSEILKSDQARGRLLHFFANHELLAIETMAYVLLKFPDAPESFRKGVFRVLQEEQRHFGAYLERMEEYGVAFGEVPLNLYFWNTLKGINRPLDFVVQMSLTFEQANLDFALEYATLFETQMNDPKTADLLRTVHDDEIRHVEHGWRWFKEWRDPEAGSDFEAYQEALPFPMTPRRARGGRFFASDSRAKAGMTKEFIEEVKIVGGSRGRVPNYYFFNPQCEVEQSLPTLPGPLKKKVADLEPLVLWLAKEEDCVELAKRPARDFLSRLHQVKGEIPEMLTKEDEFSRYTAFDEFRPWGFSSSAWNRMGRIGKKFRSPPAFDSKLHENFLFSKAYWKRILNTEGAVIDSSDSLHQWLRENSESTGTFLVKSAINTSGRGHLRLEGIQLRDPVLIRKLGKRIESGEQLVIEPFFEKLADFSVQY
jgi:uncharacterized ferritin-like protein (DUF455 family)